MLARDFYLRFVGLVNALNKDELELAIDPVALRLLDIVATAHAKGEPMTVRQAMKLKEVASPATVHRKLRALNDAGLLTAEFQGRDRRTKYLTPTAKAIERFDAIGEAMLKLTASGS